MADTGKTVLILGLVGAGGYLFYEYSQYQSFINTLASSTGQSPTALQTALPFFSFLQEKWSAGTATGGGAAATPGTTTSGQVPVTTVTTTPTSTPTTTAGTAPTQTQPGATITALAQNMQSNINMSSANADQWDYAFQQIMGSPIDQKYGLNFDQVYGPVVGGQRNNGATMSATTFLQLAASAAGGSLPGLSGLGAIRNFAGPRFSTVGNMLYQIHHPVPYSPSFRVSGLGRAAGLGAYTQATGFERALWAGGGLMRQR